MGPRFEPWRFCTAEKENYADYKECAVLLGGSLQVVRRVEDLVAERRVAATVMSINWVEGKPGAGFQHFVCWSGTNVGVAALLHESEHGPSHTSFSSVLDW